MCSSDCPQPPPPINLWLLGAWILGGCSLALAAWSAFSAHRVLYPERYPVPPPDPVPVFTTHRLQASDGASVDVWRLEARVPRARILVCHGFYANRFQVFGIADGLRQRGYEVVLFELRGHGARPGPCTLGLRETDDALAVLRWATGLPNDRPLPVGVLGLSMGAAVLCQVAARAPEVRAVVADSVYSRFFPVLRRVIRERYRLPAYPWAWLTWWSVQVALGARLSARDPAALAPSLRQPLFAIQGGDDQRVPPLLGRELFERWAGPKRRWFEPQVAHVRMFAQHPREYCDRVAAFFNEVLPERAS